MDCIGTETEVSIRASAVVSVSTDTAKVSDLVMATEETRSAEKIGGCCGIRWWELRVVGGLLSLAMGCRFRGCRVRGTFWFGVRLVNVTVIGRVCGRLWL